MRLRPIIVVIFITLFSSARRTRNLPMEQSAALFRSVGQIDRWCRGHRCKRRDKGAELYEDEQRRRVRHTESDAWVVSAASRKARLQDAHQARHNFERTRCFGDQLHLPIGSVAETVTVEGGAPLINTGSGSVSTVIDQTMVQNLPLNGRSFNTLLQLTPGVVIAPSSSSSQGQFSIAGQRTSANNFLVDGVSANFGVSSSSD